MAVLYGRDYNFDYETLPVSGQSEEVESLLSVYSIPEPHSFRSLYLFKETCKRFYTLLDEGEEKNPYLGFTHVTMSDFEAIDEIRSEVPMMTIHYDWNEETLIVKFMVGPHHETCAELLAMELDTVYKNRTGNVRAFFLHPLGRSRCRGAHRMKEGDKAYKPKTRIGTYDWPSIVFEVGVSQTMENLRHDAQFWLGSSRGQTRIVILVCVDRDARSMVIGRWQVGAGAAPIRQQPPRNMGRANQYAQRLVGSCVQRVALAEGQVYVGPSLHIPANLVYDVMPPGLQLGPADFDITPQSLNDFNTDYWAELQ
jgi:hypothetical protein